MHRICFHFQVNQPYLLRTYRFFDINQKHDYFDEYQNNYLINRLADRCYLPANEMLLNLIRHYGDKIAFSFSISGATIELFRQYCPHVLDSFRQLVDTGQVEIAGSTYSHSLSALHSKSSFMEEIGLQEKLLAEIFKTPKPTTFCNTEIIYSDEIGEWLHEAGYQVVLTEGARHLLGWRSPYFLYCNPFQTDLKLLLRSYQLCDDITLRFSDHGWDQFPLTAEKYISFLDKLPNESMYINLYFDYETIGDYHPKETGIFDFFHHLFSQLAESDNFNFIVPSQASATKDTISTMHVPWPISCSGDEKDINEWIGNELQQEAYEQLYKLESLYHESKNKAAKLAWLRLQNAVYFNFMSTKWFPKQAVKRFFDVYPSPYQAFINYMNVVNDVKVQLSEK